jgi:hypothetical protein
MMTSPHKEIHFYDRKRRLRREAADQWPSFLILHMYVALRQWHIVPPAEYDQ